MAPERVPVRRRHAPLVPPHTMPRHVWAMCVQTARLPQGPLAPPSPPSLARRRIGAPTTTLAPVHVVLPLLHTPPPPVTLHPIAGVLTAPGTCLAGPAPPPVGSVTAPPVCHACRSPIKWSLPRYYTHCSTCALTNVIRARQCPYPDAPPLPDPARPPAPVVLVDPSVLVHASGRALVVEDFLWALLRSHPDDPSWLVLSRRGTAVALLPARWAAAARAACLLHWRAVAPSARVNEADVVAYLLAAILTGTALPAPPTGPFPGDHFTFAPATWLYEPGALRPVQCDPLPGPVHPAHPAASPYLPVAGYGLPLKPDAHHALLAPVHHPYTGLIVNSLTAGFPTTALPPTVTREGQWAAPSPHDPLARAAIQVERDMGATVDASDWPDHGVPLRLCPLYAILKSSGVAKRLVQDLSAGPDAVNTSVHTAPLPPVRLAHLRRILQRVLYLQQRRPGARVFIQRVDLVQAYRNVPLASNCRWQIVHRLRDGSLVASNGLVLGIIPACQSMGSLSGAVEDHFASLDILAAAYVDDTILVAYEDEIDDALAQLIALFERLGWTVHRGKLEADGPPAAIKDVLGVTVNTIDLTVSIPPAKLAAICADLARWRRGDAHVLPPRRARELAGTLNWCATTLPLARPFLSPLYDYGYGSKHQLGGPGAPSARHPPATTPPIVLEALAFWEDVLSTFNGVSSFAPVPPSNVVEVWSDASGRGWGFVCPATGEYAHGRWSALERRAYSTTHWEAVAACGAGITFGSRVPGGVVLVNVDSASSFHAFTRLRCKDARLRALLRSMCLLQIQCRFRLALNWVAGASNVHADWVSRHDTFPHHLWPSSSPAPRRLAAWWRPRPTTTTPPSSVQPPPSPSSPSLAPVKATPPHSPIGIGTVTPWAVAPSTKLPLTPWRGH